MQKKIVLALLLLAIIGCSKKEKEHLLQPLATVEKAAEQGRIEAQLEIGNRYCNGDGVEADISEAIKWYTKAALQGNAEAQCCLACCSFLGMGVDQDTDQGMSWLHKATAQESPLALLVMAFCHETGVGVPQNSSDALRWAKRSASHGLKISCFIVGRMYIEPLHGTPRFEQGAKWLQKASDQEIHQAISQLPKPIATFCNLDADSAGDILGSCYSTLALAFEQGHGVKKNIPEAIKWYQLAANQGSTLAIQALARLRKN